MNAEWREFTAYADAASAEVVAGLLRSEGVPVNVAADEPIPGLLKGFRLMVPTHLLDQAQRVVSQTEFNEEELALFVAGQPGGEEQDSSSQT